MEFFHRKFLLSEDPDMSELAVQSVGGVNVSILVKKHASKFDKNDLANLWNCTELKNDFISKIDKVQLIG